VIRLLKGAALRARCPIALATEGGYDLDALRACLDAALTVLSEDAPVAITADTKVAPRAERALEAVRAAQKSFWTTL
jgi:hypothetical protein